VTSGLKCAPPAGAKDQDQHGQAQRREHRTDQQPQRPVAGEPGRGDAGPDHHRHQQPGPGQFGQQTPARRAHAAVGLTARITLADPTRLRLVSMVAAHEGREACVCELTEPLGLTQPTISHHLKILVDAGIFSRDKRGVWAYYALRPAALQALADILGDTTP
jgi:ArsR family transcriptional regulator